VILSRDTPTFSRLGSSFTDVSFMVAFCSNAVGLKRCAGSKRNEDGSVPCDCIDCILDAKHSASATIGSASSILIELESLAADTTRPMSRLTGSTGTIPNYRSLCCSVPPRCPY
jgi:hypothetical protein